jgi:tetratricopeptide (TPR) repeat protein
MSAKQVYIRGLGSLTRGDMAGAEEAFRESIEIEPGFGLGYLGLSQVLDRQVRIDEAIEAARKAIELMREDPLPHTSLSRLYQQKDMIDEAEAEMALSMKLQNKAGG